MLGLPCRLNHRFTLQNGREQLQRHFHKVSLTSREDALDVTYLPDLINYLRSMQGMNVLAELPDQQLMDAFSRHMSQDVLSLPKEYGLFLCR